MPKSSTKSPSSLGIKRPKNSFMIYRSLTLKTLSSEDRRRGQQDLSKIIAAKWNEESAEMRNFCIDLAEIDKKEHKERHPDYVYRPQKRNPSSKKKKPVIGKKKRIAQKPQISEIAVEPIASTSQAQELPYVPQDVDSLLASVIGSSAEPNATNYPGFDTEHPTVFGMHTSLSQGLGEAIDWNYGADFNNSDWNAHGALFEYLLQPAYEVRDHAFSQLQQPGPVLRSDTPPMLPFDDGGVVPPGCSVRLLSGETGAWLGTAVPGGHSCSDASISNTYWTDLLNSWQSDF